MEEKIVALGLKVRKMTFFRVIQRTFTVLFPFILLGSFAQVLEFSLLYPDGFLGNLLSLSEWLPHYKAANQALGSIYMLTVGLISVLAALLTAKQTAKLAGRDGQMAGLTGMLVFLALCYQPNTGVNKAAGQFNFRLDLLGFNGLLLGLVLGYVVGLLFKYLTPPIEKVEDNRFLSNRSFQALLPLTLALVLAVGANLLLGLLYKYQVFTVIDNWLQSNALKSQNILSVTFFAWISLLFSWIGLSGPYANNTFDSDQSALKNLSYALTHSDLNQIPDKYNANTLYFSFGMVAGTGATLALALALMLVVKRKNERKLAYWSVGPVLFNSTSALMIGLPVLFNPFYVLPFTLIPLFNIFVGALALKLGLLPAVYPVLLSTPGPLYAFIGTNGSWPVLCFTLVLVVIDVLLYIPFVKFAERVTDELERERRKEERLDEVK